MRFSCVDQAALAANNSLNRVTAVIAFVNFTTRPNVALGIESDGFAAACGLRPLAQPSVVGSST